MSNLIWFGISFVVLIIVWLLLRKKKNSYGIVRTEGSLWEKVKDACCTRRN